MHESKFNNNHLTEQELIRKYLDDELSQEEELMVAERYESDAEFRDALDGMEMMSGAEFNDVMTGISAKIDTKISAAAGSGQVKDINDSGAAGGRNVFRMHSIRRLAVAASIVLLVFLGGAILMNQVRSPMDKLVAGNFEAKPYPDLITRGTDDLSEKEKIAISAYNSEKYEVSVKHFEDLYEQYPDIQKYGLFLGISQMGISQYEKAVETMLKVKENADVYEDDVDWYLGLSYLKIKQLEKAKPLFERLADNQDSYYSKPALNIFKKLK